MLFPETFGIVERSRARSRRALEILDELSIVEGWRPYGRPVVVGAVANELALDPDIDLEVYCPDLRPEHGFAVLAEAARNPAVKETLFQNHLADPDKALYWQLRYEDADGEIWKIDMWSASDDYDLPRGERLVAPLGRALTPERRQAILELKAWRAATPDVTCLSVDLYRAVIDYGVRVPHELLAWMAQNAIGVLTPWLPAE
jgi:hypothetical protein